MHPTQLKQQFLSRLKDLSHSRSPHRAFSDWLEIAAISMHQLPYHSGKLPEDEAFESLETQYLERIKPYNKEELLVFSELLGLTISAHHGDYSDFLGEIAGESELLNKRGGQFFTPYHLCRVISKMTFGDVKQQVKAKGVLSVCEPAVGAGALVIASAEEVASQGVDPCAHLQFDCTDVSRDAFNMAYIQLSALGLQAIVRHGNTLSMEYWEHRPTPQLRLFHQWLEPHQRTYRLVQSMRELLSGENAPVPIASGTDDATTDQLPEKCDRLQPDVVLDRQMELFG